jgi:excisionase family DNA binding protein
MAEMAASRMAHSLDGGCFQLGGVSRDTLERMISRGDIKIFRIGRRRFISNEELQRFIREREQAGA